MRLLHLTPELPYAPGGTGGATRQYQLLRGLVERGHDVAVVAPVAPAQAEGAQRLRAAGVRLYESAAALRRAQRRRSRALARSPALVARAARDPVVAWQVEVFWSALRAEAAQRALDEQRPDVVLVEHDWAAAWWRDLPAGLPRVLTLAEPVLALLRGPRPRRERRPRRGARARGAPLPALRPRAPARLRPPDHDVRRGGRGAAPRAARDAAARRSPTASTRARSPPRRRRTDPPTLLYTGTLDYAPNAEGLRWLLREVWPRVAARSPEARLLVVGRNPPDDARRLAGDEVTFTGCVADIAPCFARATAVLVPLLSGGGTKLKVLDGLSSGRPVISTPIGVEGIRAEHGRHLLVAGGAEAFADAVARVLEDAGLRDRLGREGRALAERCYDWSVLSDSLEALLTDVSRA